MDKCTSNLDFRARIIQLRRQGTAVRRIIFRMMELPEALPVGADGKLTHPAD